MVNRPKPFFLCILQWSFSALYSCLPRFHYFLFISQTCSQVNEYITLSLKSLQLNLTVVGWLQSTPHRISLRFRLILHSMMNRFSEVVFSFLNVIFLYAFFISTTHVTYINHNIWNNILVNNTSWEALYYVNFSIILVLLAY